MHLIFISKGDRIHIYYYLWKWILKCIIFKNSWSGARKFVLLFALSCFLSFSETGKIGFGLCISSEVWDSDYQRMCLNIEVKIRYTSYMFYLIPQFIYGTSLFTMHSNRFSTYKVSSIVNIRAINVNFSFKAILPEILLNHLYTDNYSKFFLF